MHADWIYGLGGGLIIGLAAAIYLLVNGRIMGASGILGGLVDGSGHDTAAERFSFLAGLIGVPAILAAIFGKTPTHLTENVAVIVAAGVLVGVGTSLASGCTSGHGVCGISRLSPRGIAATGFYILGGGLTVLIFRHTLAVI